MVAVRTTAFTSHRRRARAAEVKARLGLERELPESGQAFTDPELLAAFASLSVRWRQVIWWSEVEALGPHDIGRRLGLSPTAAAALSYRARRALRAAYLAAIAEPAEGA
jgi:DNA-directed RNA polymerase specialized sigma24 family protein